MSSSTQLDWSKNIDPIVKKLTSRFCSLRKLNQIKVFSRILKVLPLCYTVFSRTGLYAWAEMQKSRIWVKLTLHLTESEQNDWGRVEENK